MPKLVYNALLVDVAAVENLVRSFQIIHHLRPQKSVGVRENGQLHTNFPPVTARQGQL